MEPFERIKKLLKTENFHHKGHPNIHIQSINIHAFALRSGDVVLVTKEKTGLKQPKTPSRKPLVLFELPPACKCIWLILLDGNKADGGAGSSLA